MNFRAILCVLMMTIGQKAYAQVLTPPQIQWQRSYGWTNPDICFDIIARQNGFSFTGFGGMVTNQPDYWQFDADLSGAVLREKYVGSPGDEVVSTGRPAADGGFFIGGRSTSGIGGFKSETNNGAGDFWVVRLNQAGTKVWDRTFGSAGEDFLLSVVPLEDGGCVLGGTSSSISGTSIPGGNKTSPSFGGGDYWVIRLDAAGTKLWEVCYGTTNYDDLRVVLPATDGGFLLAGHSRGSTTSTGGGNRLVTGYGNIDFWVIKIDSQGNRIWEAAYGGSSADVLWCAAPTSDGGYVLGGGAASSTTGVKTSPNYGGRDYWLVRLDASGQKIWDRSYGGDSQDEIMAVEQLADGGFMMAGRSVSGVSGNKTSPGYGFGDYWIVRADANGEKLWEMSLGGSLDEWPYAMRQMTDGGWVVGGYSRSGVSGNKTTMPLGVPGDDDAWLIKLGPDEWTTPPSLRWQTLGQRKLFLKGTVGVSYRIEDSTNLTNWSVLQTNKLTNPEAEIILGNLPSPTKRFLRARVVP